MDINIIAAEEKERKEQEKVKARAAKMNDEKVCHKETDKTSIPVKAPCSGVITELCVSDGATVQPGAKLFVVNSSGT